MIELVLVEIEATDQRVNGAVSRIERDECAFDFRQLRDFPGIFHRLRNPDHRASADLDLWRSLVR